MLTRDDYFAAYAGHPEITPAIEDAAAHMLDAVNELLVAAEAAGVVIQINPATGTLVSGQENGGWRPQACPIGAAHSNHKTGHAVDIYDPHGALDAWLLDATLILFGLWREHPDATAGWCHLQNLPPRSFRRTFFP